MTVEAWWALAVVALLLLTGSLAGLVAVAWAETEGRRVVDLPDGSRGRAPR